jgi:hypothetical protein
VGAHLDAPWSLLGEAGPCPPLAETSRSHSLSQPPCTLAAPKLVVQQRPCYNPRQCKEDAMAKSKDKGQKNIKKPKKDKAKK